MAKPIAVQLYSVREALAQDTEGVIRKIASFGYQGVEPFGGVNAQAVADLCGELGLKIPSTHIGLPLGEKRDEMLNFVRILGCQYLVVPWIAPDEFKTVESTIAVCNRLNEANQVARDAGLTLVYHNHWFEFEPLGDTRPYKVMAEHLDPTIAFEIDTYWAQVSGCDPVAVIDELGTRVPLLHIKDGPADGRESPMVAVGEGVMDVPAIVAAGKHAEWLIVELDRCATDMLEAVRTSYGNLEQIARGN
ncbi:MAG: sugar phosphate isomerase/epimerase [Anaerolineae bacterium]|nr:sugar phosphate isomerase/epimerase [Anaerolineae bacterium]